MAYTTEAKIQSMFRKLEIDANAVVTTNEVDEFIARADEIIDSKLYRYYETPITGAKSLLIIEEISTLMVAHRIKTILELSAQTSDKVQEVQTNLQKQAEKLLNDITPTWNKSAKRWDPGTLVLSDADAKEFSPDNGALFNSHNKNSTPNRVITRGGNNW